MKERVLVTVEVDWSAAGADETVASCQVCESWATALVARAANAAAATVKRIVIEFAIGMAIDSGLFVDLEASLARCVANKRMDACRQVVFCDGASTARGYGLAEKVSEGACAIGLAMRRGQTERELRTRDRRALLEDVWRRKSGAGKQSLRCARADGVE